MNIFVNRVLNLKTIKAIGLDMDHTLIRYNSKEFEALTFKQIIEKLITLKSYPQEIRNFPFEFERTMRGVVVDRKQGNLIKVDHFGRVKMAYSGHRLLPYKEMQQCYRGLFVDLSSPDFYSVDTSFSIAGTVAYLHLVELKNSQPNINLPRFDQMMDDIQYALDLAHVDDSLKGAVSKNPSLYLMQEPDTVRALEAFKKKNKVLMVITNSDFAYCQKLLDFCVTPHLKEHPSWRELFDWVITCAEKPSFFKENKRFLKINPKDGTMVNLSGPLVPGIYQGGGAYQLQQALLLQGDEILYIGDHIYGDIVRLKKQCGWRTALVLDELDKEVQAFQQAQTQLHKIEDLTRIKEKIEEELRILQNTQDQSLDPSLVWDRFNSNNELLNQAVTEYQAQFNPYWGEMLRAGVEESFLMGQIRRYACVYMNSVGAFCNYYPNHFFRPKRVPLPHE